MELICEFVGDSVNCFGSVKKHNTAQKQQIKQFKCVILTFFKWYICISHFKMLLYFVQRGGGIFCCFFPFFSVLLSFFFLASKLRKYLWIRTLKDFKYNGPQERGWERRESNSHDPLNPENLHRSMPTLQTNDSCYISEAYCLQEHEEAI